MGKVRDAIGVSTYGILTGLVAFFVIYFAHELMVDFLSWMFEKTSEVDLYLSYILTFAAILSGGLGLMVIFALLGAFGWWAVLKRLNRNSIDWYGPLFLISVVVPLGLFALYL